MKFLSFQKQMQHYPLFTTQDLRFIFPEENIHTVNKQISLWAKQKKIVGLKNGMYMLSSDYTKEVLSPQVIAAKLYSPSYISLEYALSLYGLIPEATFEITSVTTKPTRVFETPNGVFRYHTIKPSCFFGFLVNKQGKMPAYLATPEKALLDFLYLNSNRFTPEFQTWDNFRLGSLEKVNFNVLIRFAKKFRRKKLLALVLNLKQYATSH